MRQLATLHTTVENIHLEKEKYAEEQIVAIVAKIKKTKITLDDLKEWSDRMMPDKPKKRKVT